jgi:hypothetical protein
MCPGRSVLVLDGPGVVVSHGGRRLALQPPLALSWAAGIGAKFLLVNRDAVPAAERAAAGLRNPGGPIAAADFGSALALVLTALVAIALNRALATYANGVTLVRATPDDWTTTAALSFLGVGVLSHVAIGLRWPFALKTR